MTTEHEAAIEAAQKTVVVANVCGLTIDGEYPCFCDDPRADDEVRQKTCECKITANAAIAAYEQHRSKEAVAWLRDLQPDAEDEALAVCIEGDPGSFPVYDHASPQPADVGALRALLKEVRDHMEAGLETPGPLECEASIYEREFVARIDAALATTGGGE